MSSLLVQILVLCVFFSWLTYLKAYQFSLSFERKNRFWISYIYCLALFYSTDFCSHFYYSFYLVWIWFVPLFLVSQNGNLHSWLWTFFFSNKRIYGINSPQRTALVYTTNFEMLCFILICSKYFPVSLLVSSLTYELYVHFSFILFGVILDFLLLLISNQRTYFVCFQSF